MFFALLPDAATRAALAELEAGLPSGGRRIPEANLHITLAFVGQCGEEELACLCRAASAIETRPFALVLDRLRVFRRSGVLWLGSSQAEPALGAWREALVAELAGHCGIRADSGTWIPHVTLRRNWRRPPPAVPLQPLVWQGDGRFFLMCSEPCPEGGVRYLPLAVFPRTGAA